VKDGYDWSAYAEQFIADITSNLALVCEIESEDWSENGDVKALEDVNQVSEAYYWSAKSDPYEESEAEVALKATSEESITSAEFEQPKVSPELPPNYVQMPDDLRNRLCSKECIAQVEHYRNHSFKIYDKLSKHENIHEKLK